MHTETRWKNATKTCFHEYFDDTCMTLNGCPHQRSHEIYIAAFNVCPAWHLLIVNTTGTFSVSQLVWMKQQTKKTARSNENIHCMYQRNAFSATLTSDITHQRFTDRSVAAHCCHRQRCCLITVHCVHLTTRHTYQHLCKRSHLLCM